jgi:hypothetical protein
MRSRSSARGTTAGRFGWNNATFSNTLSAGTSVKFWKTMPTPSARQSLGAEIATRSPFTRMSPASAA